MSALPSSAACRRAAFVALGVTALCRPAAADGETDFVKTALAHGGFKTFVALVSRAGLTDTLGASPVTVFMPTDAAFARLSSAQRKSITDLPPEGVKSFVGRFVFPGTAMASNDIDKTITSESGTVYNVTWYKGRLSLRGDRGPATSRLAYVVQGDIPAGRGVIDAVNAVLMPETTGGLAVSPAATPVPARSADEAPAAAGPALAMPASGASATPGTPAPTPMPKLPHDETPAAAASSAPAVPASGASATPGTPAPTPVPLPSPDEAPSASASSLAVPAPAPPPNQAKPVAAPSPAVPATAMAAPAPMPARPEVTVAAAGLRGWPLKVSGTGATGKVNGVVIGLPGGRVMGLSAHFGGFLGFGGRSVYVPWSRVTPDVKAHVLRARMTATEFAAAPARPPRL